MEKAPRATNILRLGGRVKNRFTQIRVTVVLRPLVQGLLEPLGLLSQQTIELKVCNCCSLNHRLCRRTKTDKGIEFTLPKDITPSTVQKEAVCLTKRVIH